MKRKQKSKTKFAGAQRKYRKEKLSQGLCVVAYCLNKLSSDNYCGPCLVKRRDWEKTRSVKRAADGYCYKCTINPAAPYLVNCVECWFKQKAGANTKSVRNAQALKDLWEKQDGKCAISGLPLTIGLNVSLDHIVPKSKGGSNKVDNFQWVLTSVNSFKLTNSLEEMFTICKAIISHNRL